MQAPLVYPQYALLLELLNLTLGIPPENVATLIALHIPGADEDAIALTDPGATLHLTPYPTDARKPILALYHHSVVTEHLLSDSESVINRW